MAAARAEAVEAPRPKASGVLSFFHIFTPRHIVSMFAHRLMTAAKPIRTSNISIHSRRQYYGR